MTGRPWLTSLASGWALSNWGVPRGFYRTRREAIAEAVESSGEPWRKCKRYFEVRKARIVPADHADGVAG